MMYNRKSGDTNLKCSQKTRNFKSFMLEKNLQKYLPFVKWSSLGLQVYFWKTFAYCFSTTNMVYLFIKHILLRERDQLAFWPQFHTCQKKARPIITPKHGINLSHSSGASCKSRHSGEQLRKPHKTIFTQSPFLVSPHHLPKEQTLPWSPLSRWESQGFKGLKLVAQHHPANPEAGSACKPRKADSSAQAGARTVHPPLNGVRSRPQCTGQRQVEGKGDGGSYILFPSAQQVQAITWAAQRAAQSEHRTSLRQSFGRFGVGSHNLLKGKSGCRGLNLYFGSC